MPWDFWLIFVVLGLVLPWRGRLRIKKLLALPATSSRERLLLYASTMAFQWLAALVVAWRVWARGLRREDLGLAVHGWTATVAGAIVGAATLAALQWLNLRRMGRRPTSPQPAREFMRILAKHILPQSPLELAPYLLLATTAGLCEEFLYRGFAMAALSQAGAPLWAAVLLSAILFGLAHLYQGRGGFVSTLVLGAVFGAARIAYHGLLPVVVWHFAIDAIAGVVGPRYLLGPREMPGKPEFSTVAEH